MELCIFGSKKLFKRLFCATRLQNWKLFSTAGSESIHWFHLQLQYIHTQWCKFLEQEVCEIRVWVHQGQMPKRHHQQNYFWRGLPIYYISKQPCWLIWGKIRSCRDYLALTWQEDWVEGRSSSGIKSMPVKTRGCTFWRGLVGWCQELSVSNFLIGLQELIVSWPMPIHWSPLVRSTDVRSFRM